MNQIIATDKAPAAIGPYSQAVKAGDFLYVSGQLALCPESGALLGEDAAAQTRQVLKNAQAIVEAAGYTLADTVKTTVYLKNMADFAAMNAVYAEFFPSNPPARAAFQVAALPKDGLVEIELVLHKSQGCCC